MACLPCLVQNREVRRSVAEGGTERGICPTTCPENALAQEEMGKQPGWAAPVVWGVCGVVCVGGGVVVGGGVWGGGVWGVGSGVVGAGWGVAVRVCAMSLLCKKFRIQLEQRPNFPGMP